MNNSKSISLIAISIAYPGKQDKLKAAQQKLVKETLKEPGCLRYELHQSIEDPNILAFVETWASEAEWRAHMQGEPIRHFQESGAGNLIADFTMHRMHNVSEK